MDIEPSKHELTEPGNEQVKGLTMLTAAIFIVGEMSGTGVLSLPFSIEQSNWPGVLMIVVCCIVSGYCGIRLSSSWLLIQSKNPSLRHGVRDPFPTIAYEAGGRWARYLVLVVSYVQLFGVAVIFLLIAAHNLASLLNTCALHFCDWTIVIAVVMAPIAMLGTPKDFWPIAVGAMLFTGFACVLIFSESMRQLSVLVANNTALPDNNPVEFEPFFEAFGTILFCFGGAVMFPTIQSDMKRPGEFAKSVVVSYIVMLIFYLPVAISGFFVFAKNTSNNIIDNMDDNWMKTTTLILITGHLLTAFNIILNPVFQGLESALNAPPTFGVKRVFIRLGTVLSVLFVAQSIPNFGPILSLIGGSTVSLSSFILPCIFYFLLCRNPIYEKKISWLELVVLAICILVSTFGGVVSTYSSINALFDASTFKKPCYLDRTQ